MKFDMEHLEINKVSERILDCTDTVAISVNEEGGSYLTSSEKKKWKKICENIKEPLYVVLSANLSSTEAYYVDGMYIKPNGRIVQKRKMISLLDEKRTGIMSEFTILKNKERQEQLEHFQRMIDWEKERFEIAIKEDAIKKSHIEKHCVENKIYDDFTISFLDYFIEKDIVGFSHENDSWSGKGRGYSRYSESNNAVVSKKEGKFPKSLASKILGVSIKKIEKYLNAVEFHHSSKFYNNVMFYDIRVVFYLYHENKKALNDFYSPLSEKGYNLEEIEQIKKDDICIFEKIYS